MKTIVSKRDSLHFYSVIIFSGCFILLALLLIKVSIEEYQKGEVSDSIFGILHAIVMFVGGVIALMEYFKLAPIICINNKTIKFNKKAYNLQDIETIKLMDLIDYKYAWYMRKYTGKGIKIYFRNDKKDKYIINSMYSNIWIITLFLEQVVGQKQEFELAELEQIDALDLTEPQRYTGNYHIFSKFTGYTLFTASFLVVLIFFETGLWVSQRIDMSLILILSILLIFVMATTLHAYLLSISFCIITRNCLIIKNPILFWKTDYHKLSNIKEIRLEGGKSVKSLNIIEKNYKTNSLSTSFFEQKELMKLIDVLEAKGIQIQYKNIIEID